MPAHQVIVAVRNPDKAAAFAARGVQVRLADYARPETLPAAFEEAQKVLFISSSEAGERLAQHRAVVEAARTARVQLLVYTSILHADTSRLELAVEHKETERLIRASGLPFIFLRNGWYTENYTENLGTALEHGALVGSSGEGRISAASRADYAAAAVAVLTGAGRENTVYELAGDTGFTLGELSAELSRQTGKSIAYKNLPPEQYRGVLTGAGVPACFAQLLVDSDVGASQGELSDTSRQLSHLIGRPTTPLAQSIAHALR